ncbi:MAG: S41 family peptidase [Emergencia sp.]|nr:S41 family peptidase [Emergencia sp.]
MIKIRKRQFVAVILCTVLATLLLTAGGFILYSGVTGVKLVQGKDYNMLTDLSQKYSKLYTLQTTINDKFLWETDEKEQMEVMYKALVDSLGDKYSSYMNEEETEKWNRYVTGVFSGIGITFTENEKGQMEISSVIGEGPADVSGIKAGDIIRKVDGKRYSTLEEVSSAIQGEEGTVVKLTYLRGKTEKTVSIIRGVVEERSVYAGTVGDSYGYIRITGFEKSTAEQFKRELSAFENNKKIKGVVIDLRNNLGGIMEQSIEIADVLLPECTIIHTEDGKGNTEFFNSDESCTKLKYVLLINENSASASEILAAAIKDNKGGKLVGMKTYGKGIIQNSMMFSDNTSLKLTTMQYLSPKNHKIHGVGVSPDYKVKQPKNAKEDMQLKKAISLLS